MKPTFVVAFLVGAFLVGTANLQLTIGLLLMIGAYTEYRNIDIVSKFKNLINETENGNTEI